MTTVAYLAAVVLPAAFALLPATMDTPAARAQLLAIALQESKCIARRQYGNGPALSFLQFEIGGVAGVLTHRASKERLYSVLLAMNYPPSAAAVHAATEHNDILACILGRLLLWTDAKPLPGPSDVDGAWALYLRTWRPGKPHRDTWDKCYRDAWTALGAEAA